MGEKQRVPGTKKAPERKKATAPYNFVPFSEKVLWAKEDGKKDFCAIDKEGFTGEISYTFTAETPILVAGAEKEDKKEFYRTAQGDYAVPGSSLRGVIRHNIQILGFDTVQQDIHDYSIMFRNMASSSDAIASAKGYYHDILDIKQSRPKNGKPFSRAENAKSGYVCKEKEGYAIYPSVAKYLRVPLSQLSSKEKNRYFHSETLQYKGDGKGKEGILFQKEPVEGYQRGIFFCTGKSPQENAKYIFPEMDREAKALSVTEEDILAYQMDYERRIRVDHDKASTEFWKLPQEGEEKPVFYVELEGRCYFGMSQFLRIPHKGSIFDGLPKEHKKKKLTFVEQILGRPEEQDRESLPSKVFFEDAITENPKEYGQFPVILGEPIPSFSPSYVQEGKHYSSPDFQLSGFKEYWLKDFEKPPVPGKLNPASILCPLDKGSKFTGKIRFQNLSQEEFGLLLWAVELEDGCRQSIGMGKPLGMGRVKLDITQVKVFDFARMYQAMTPSYLPLDIPKIVESYQKYAEKTLGIPLTGDKRVENIATFFYIRKKIVTDLDAIADMGYNRQNVTTILGSIAQMEQDFGDVSIETSLQALLEKFKKG